MESAFYRTLLSHVVCLQFIHKSHFSHALLNMHVSCSAKRSERMSDRKRVRTIESFFASNRSQTESEENDTEDNSVLIRKKRMRSKGNRKNHEHSKKPCCKLTYGSYEKEAMFCFFLLEIFLCLNMMRKKSGHQ